MWLSLVELICWFSSINKQKNGAKYSISPLTFCILAINLLISMGVLHVKGDFLFRISSIGKTG
nr:hypothetical protein BN993_00627 [Virgibacillus halodenitrificans]